jgi:CubicO group peptidase (beta-lactamase class C family)
MKYIISTVLFSFLIVNCNQQDTAAGKINYKVPEKPTLSIGIDSAKFKEEIFRLDTLFNNMHKQNQFNANVLIAKDNQIIYQKSFGYAIKEKNKILTDSSIFQIASVTKVITSIGVLILYEQGKLHLDKKVCDILPEFPYKQITIKHLLTHRSGLPNYTYFCCDYLKDDNIQLCNKNIFDVMAKYQPKQYHNQDTRFNYSNTNYAILALIIEKLSGKTYSEFLTQELFIPLGMKNTHTLFNLNSFNPNLTHGYTANFKQIGNDRFDGVVGDKGIYTTTYDLLLLSAALYQHKLLKPETQALAYQPYSSDKKLSNYGFGWRMKNMNDKNKEVFHNGWWHGYRTAFHRRLNDSITIIVLSNTLNKDVYSTWRIYAAIDGPMKTPIAANKNEDE